MRCSICASADRDELDRALVGGQSNRAIARQFGVGRDALARHVKSGHVPLRIETGAAADESERVTSLTERAEFLWRRASVILDAAEGRPNIELAALRELRGIVELLGKLTGSLAAAEDHPIRISLTFSDRPLPSLREVRNEADAQ